MRQITSHRVNPANDQIEIEVLDGPGAGGANHHYRVSWPACYSADPNAVTHAPINLTFQNGPIADCGVNGITQEAIIAICIDRLEGFQKGPFACRENALALTKLQEAQMWLQKRTLERVARGVEGTHEK
jgi:hypothetical protein